VFVTGHVKDDGGQGETNQGGALDWSNLARPAQTVVFYMGLGHLDQILLRLREHGAPQSRAAAIVEQGTRATQRVVTGTLADLAQKAQAAGVQSPALLIVGEVARLHDTLRWFNTAPSQQHAVPLFAALNEGRLTA
jgi:siroheme synthase